MSDDIDEHESTARYFAGSWPGAQVVHSHFGGPWEPAQ